MSIPRTERVQIGSYSFDPAARLLFRNGDEVLLSRKAGDLLAFLLTNRNRLVSRERIFAQVWPEGYVHEGNLTQTIYLLRKFLAADPAVAIENVPRRGYRLRILDKESNAAKRWPSKAHIILIGGLVLAAFACIGIWMHFRAADLRQLPPGAREDIAIAMYHFDRFVDLGLARAHFMRITREAPNAPEGYAGLALVDAIDGFDSPDRERYCAEGRSSATRANSLGVSTLGDVSDAMLSVTCDLSLSQAQRELDAALALNPSDPMALTLRSRVAFWESRPHEAISFATKAVAVDPTSPEALLTLGLAYYYGGNFHSARDTFRRLLELMPDRPAALEFLEHSYEALDDFSNADHTLREARRDRSNASWVWSARARLLARTGHRAEALAMLQRWAVTSDPESVAAAYVALGDDQAAIRQLKIAALQHSLRSQVSWLNDFRFAPLRRKYPGLTPSFATWR